MAKAETLRQRRRIQDWRKQEALKLLEELETYRKARGLSYRKLRHELSVQGLFVSYATLMSWKNRIKIPGVITLAALRPTLERMRVDWLNDPTTDYDLEDLLPKDFR